MIIDAALKNPNLLAQESNEAPPPPYWTEGLTPNAFNEDEGERLDEESARAEKGRLARMYETQGEEAESGSEVGSEATLVGPSTALLSGAFALEVDGPPTNFHIYNTKGLLLKDRTITGDDKSTTLYYLTVSKPLFTWSWILSLHSKSKDGPLLATINRHDKLATFTIKFSDQEAPMLFRGKNMFSTAHAFEFEGKNFRWTMENAWNQGLECKDEETGKVMGHYRRSVAVTKEGQIRLNGGLNEKERLVFLVTGLALVQLITERR